MRSVSKAIAGALVAMLIAFLAKNNIVLSAEIEGALGLLLDAILAAAIGYGVVYFAPKNRETR